MPSRNALPLLCFLPIIICDVPTGLGGGTRQSQLQELERAKQTAVENQDFQKAAQIKNQMVQLKHMPSDLAAQPVTRLQPAAAAPQVSAPQQRHSASAMGPPALTFPGYTSQLPQQMRSRPLDANIPRQPSVASPQAPTQAVEKADSGGSASVFDTGYHNKLFGLDFQLPSMSSITKTVTDVPKQMAQELVHGGDAVSPLQMTNEQLFGFSATPRQPATPPTPPAPRQATNDFADMPVDAFPFAGHASPMEIGEVEGEIPQQQSAFPQARRGPPPPPDQLSPLLERMNNFHERVEQGPFAPWMRRLPAHEDTLPTEGTITSGAGGGMMGGGGGMMGGGGGMMGMMGGAGGGMMGMLGRNGRAGGRGGRGMMGGLMGGLL